MKKRGKARAPLVHQKKFETSPDAAEVHRKSQDVEKGREKSPSADVPAKKTDHNFVERVLRSRGNEYVLLKMLLGALLGAGISYGYYWVAFRGTFSDFSEELEQGMLGFIMITATLACTFFPQARCIALICLPTMLGRTGRSCLRSLVVAWVMAGPIENIIYHSEESMRSLSCAAKLQVDHTKRIFRLLHRPLTVGLRNIVDSKSAMNESKSDVEDEMGILEKNLLADAGIDSILEAVEEGGIDPTPPTDKFNKGFDALNQQMEKLRRGEFAEEDEDENEDELYGDGWGDDEEPDDSAIKEMVEGGRGPIALKMRRKAIVSCLQMVHDAGKLCEEAYKKAFNLCFQRIPFGFVGCHFLPGKNCMQRIKTKMNQQCIEEGVDMYNMAEVDGNYTDLDVTSYKLDKGYQGDLLWEVPELNEIGSLKTVGEVVTRTNATMTTNYKRFEFVKLVVSKLFGFMFVLVIIKSAKYTSRYLCDFKFDNVYITPYFIRKDKERRAQDKRFLLPLRKIEKRSVIFPLSLKLTTTEKKNIAYRVMKVLAEIGFTALVFLFNDMIYTILHQIQQNAHMELSITGRHKLSINVTGTGPIAKLMRKLFAPFDDNNEELLNITSSNINCLPVPQPLPPGDMEKVIIFYSILLAATIFDAHVGRLKRVIASTTYRRREKSRIVYLYGDMMRARKGYIQHVHKSVKRLARNYRLKQKHSILLGFRLKWPQLDKFFTALKMPKFRCLICDEAETKEYVLVRCPDPKCSLPYCRVCWLELDSTCWACKHYNRDEIKEDVTWDELHPMVAPGEESSELHAMVAPGEESAELCPMVAPGEESVNPKSELQVESETASASPGSETSGDVSSGGDTFSGATVTSSCEDDYTSSDAEHENDAGNKDDDHRDDVENEAVDDKAFDNT